MLQLADRIAYVGVSLKIVLIKYKFRVRIIEGPDKRGPDKRGSTVLLSLMTNLYTSTSKVCGIYTRKSA